MGYDILVTKHLNNGYSARPLLWPELVLSGANEAEVVERVRVALADFLAHSRIVRVEVEPVEDETDPWLRYAGIWQDLPDDEWNEYLTAVNDFRAEMDKQSQDATLPPNFKERAARTDMAAFWAILEQSGTEVPRAGDELPAGVSSRVNN